MDYIYYLSLLRSDYNDIINYCRTHINGKIICSDKSFWIEKAKNDLNISPKLFNNTDLSPSQRYLELLTINGGVSVGSEYYININKCMKRAIRQDLHDVIKHLLGSTFNNHDLMIKEYAAKGNLEMVKKYLPLSESYFIYQDIAVYAIRNKHLNLFNYFRNINNNYDVKTIRRAAVRSGDISIFNYIYSINPDEPIYEADFNSLAREAILSGDTGELSSWIFNNTHVEDLLDFASQSKHKEMFYYLYDMVDDNEISINNLLKYASNIGDDNFFNWILEKYPDWNIDIYQWAIMLRGAMKHGRDAVKKKIKLINLIDNLSDIDKQHLNITICLYGSDTGDKDQMDYLIDYLLLLFPNKEDICWHIMLSSCARSGNIRLVDHILSRAFISYTLFNPLISASLVNDINMFKHLYNLAIIYNENFQSFINNAKSRDFFIYIYDLLPNNVVIDYNEVAINSVKNGQNNLFFYIFKITNDLRLADISSVANNTKPPNREIFEFIEKLTARNKHAPQI